MSEKKNLAVIKIKFAFIQGAYFYSYLHICIILTINEISEGLKNFNNLLYVS
jgi:hypothetical protein